ELRAIQREIAKRFSRASVDSPASIARWLADAGADLRHPEVIEFDARWREKQLRKTSSLTIESNSTKPLSLKAAERLLKRIDTARQKLLRENDTPQLRHLRDAVLNEKAKAQLITRDDTVADSLRKVQEEIVEWFRVWLQTPDIFQDWLALRQRSPE